MTYPIHKLNEPFQLPCGLTLKNRLAKASMAEALAEKGTPSKKLINVYSDWAEGDWGMILTGNVMVDEKHHGGPADVFAKDDPESRALWRDWATACKKNDTAAIVQICHPGRQSPLGAGNRGFFEKTVAPSAVPLKLGDGIIAWAARTLVFGTPRELSVEEIQKIVSDFVKTAKLSHEAGFQGIELHAAHGYLLAQFLSPKVNQRTDAYGGTPAKRAKIVLDIINQMRAELPKSFCIGMKLNSTDYQEENGLEEMIQHLSLFEQAGIDFLEISGGTYEDPQMVNGLEDKEQTPISSRSAAREAFFLGAAASIREKFPNIVLLVTGGFRTRFGMEAALHSGACDLIGIARPAALETRMPKDVILNGEVSHENASVEAGRVQLPWLLSKLPIAKAVGAGAQSAYFQKQIQRIAAGLAPIPPPIEA